MGSFKKKLKEFKSYLGKKDKNGEYKLTKEGFYDYV
jgi:hypothetical protein